MRPLRVFPVLFVIIAVSAGCAVREMGGSGAGGRTDFNNGLLTTLYEKDVGTTYAATIKALTDLGMTIRNSGKDEHLARIHATRPDDMAWVEINLRWERHGNTGAAIKVGDGDEGYSRVVARRIRARLYG